MYKKILSCIASTMLIATGICGCVNPETTVTNSGTITDENNGDSITDQKTSTAKENLSASNKTYNITWDDMQEINVVYCSMGPAGAGVQTVADEINKITESYNIHVNLTQMDIGSYEQQVSLMLSSSESLDLLITLPGGPCSFSAMSAQHQLLDITDLMEDYAPQTLEGIGDYMKGTTVDGKIYGVTCYQNFSGCINIHMRTDVLENLGLLEKAENMTSWTEYEEILKAVKDSTKWGYLAPVGCKIAALQNAYIDADKFTDCTYTDNLGDTQLIIAVDPSGNSTSVKLNYETDSYKQTYNRFKNWYDNGYMYKDMGISTETPSELVKSNVIFSFIVQGSDSPTQSTLTSSSCGMPMTTVKVMDLPISTGSITKFTWGVPSTCQAPEAAVTFLEMMFTDNRLANLMAWGVEGIHYQINDDGLACYIEGNENPDYRGADYLSVNKFIVTPWIGSPANINEIESKIMSTAKISPYLGFTCDTSTISTETSMVTNIINEYDSQVGTGMAEENIYNEFINKLKNSGSEKIINQYQEQLNSWLKQ